jgi:uncharacterized protein (DUF3820 family)
MKPPRDQQPETCHRCGSADVFEIECTVGPHHKRLVCRRCQKTIRFLEAPWTLERAESFVMPFGKNRGRSIGDLAKSAQGQDYLRWVAENVNGNASTAAELVLRGPVEGGATA